MLQEQNSYAGVTNKIFGKNKAEEARVVVLIKSRLLVMIFVCLNFND